MIKCLCKNRKLKKYIKVNDYETNTGDYWIYFCYKCQLGITSQINVEKISDLYKNKNTSDFDSPGNFFFEKLKDFLSKQLIKKITNNFKIKSFLDYGTGNLRYAIAASKVFDNAQVYAADFFKKPLYKINSKKITYINYNALDKLNKKFDIIFLRHVLEHHHKPLSLLRKLKKKLNKNGIIYIEVPNLKSGTAKIFKKNWKLWHVPRHVYHYTEHSLKKIITLANMDFIIKKIELPIMGNIFAQYFGLKINSSFPKFIGLLLHPIQLLIELFFKSSTCIYAIIRKRKII